jgi:DNA replication protein DnaC
MYLVLLALLALQVSSAILEKFQFLNASLENTLAETIKSSGEKEKIIRKAVEDNRNKASDVALLKTAEDVRAKCKVIIDELGKGRNTEWEKTIADSLICGRYNRGKIIVASTNFKFQERAATHQFNIDLERDLSGRSEFSPDQFGSLESRVGQRVFSRLREMTAFIELTGPDFRKLSSST